MNDEQIENHDDDEDNLGDQVALRRRRPNPNRLSVEHAALSASEEDLIAQNGSEYGLVGQCGFLCPDRKNNELMWLT